MSQTHQHMPSFEVLSNSSHSQITVIPEIDFSAFQYLNQTSITVSEFAGLSCSYPLFFIKDPQFGSLQSIALLSIKSPHDEAVISTSETHLPVNPYFLTGDGCNIASLPTSLMLHPFSLVHDPSDETKLTMGINTSSTLIQPDGLPLFNSDGSASEYLETVEQNLSQYFNDQLLTQNVTEQLIRLNLLQEFDVTVNYANHLSTTLKGLYNINEERLMQLNDNDKLNLLNNGVLAAIYAMLASINQLNRLIQLHNQQNANSEQLVITGISVKPAQ